MPNFVSQFGVSATLSVAAAERHLTVGQGSAAADKRNRKMAPFERVCLHFEISNYFLKLNSQLRPYGPPLLVPAPRGTL